MGISINILAFILKKRELLLGKDVLILGRQQFNFAASQEKIVNDLFKRSGVDLVFNKLVCHQYADVLFRECNVHSLTYLDYSDYQGATFLHDLNVPLPDGCPKFDVVIDSGTLEHVFDIPTSFKNIEKLLVKNGCFLCASPANNWLGHGMYQFSPELFWSGLRSCGFRINDMCLMLRDGSLEFHPLSDPRETGRRVEIRTPNGILVDIFVHAEQSQDEDRGSAGALQTDYVHVWRASKLDKT